MPNHSFDPVAPFYDALSRLVFGNALRQAQSVFLKEIPVGSRVLIIGGGSGQILTDLLQQGHCQQILFLEASEKMLNLARMSIKNKPDAHLVTFRLGTETAIRPEEQFDVIMTHFFLDLFSDRFLPPLLKTLHRTLAKGGYWVATDFVMPARTGWRRTAANIILKTMYKFFGIACQISAKTLPDWEAWLRQYGLNELQNRLFYHGMVKAILYTKNKEVTAPKV